MESQEEDKFKAHLFICTRCQFKTGSGEACPEETAKDFRKSVKDLARERWGKRVRVNQSGCLDQCERGISAVLYPQKVWFQDLRPGDEVQLVELLKEHLEA